MQIARFKRCFGLQVIESQTKSSLINKNINSFPQQDIYRWMEIVVGRFWCLTDGSSDPGSFHLFTPLSIASALS